MLRFVDANRQVSVRNFMLDIKTAYQETGTDREVIDLGDVDDVAHAHAYAS